MIISTEYAHDLIRQGKADIVGSVVGDDRFGEYGTMYIVINRLDLQRTDHYKTPAQWHRRRKASR